MRRMTKAEQFEYALRRAPELARSGNYTGWWDIEVHLRTEEDCPQARHALDDERVRENLDRLCREARSSVS